MNEPSTHATEQLQRELAEAKAYQRAISDILQIIRESPTDVTPVFQEIVQSCRRLFGSDESLAFLAREGQLHLVGYVGDHEAQAKSDYPRALEGTISGLAITQRETIYRPSVAQSPDLPEYMRRTTESTGDFSMAIAPMLWQGQCIGTITITDPKSTR